MGVFTPRAHPGGPAAVYLRTLVFVFHHEHVLLMQRTSGAEAGWWNGLGGKIDRGEDPLEAAQRELQEEAGIAPPLTFRGVATIVVSASGAHWTLFLFTARVDTPTVRPSPEGPLQWVAPAGLHTLRVFPDVLLLLPPLRAGRLVLAKFVYATDDPAAFDPTASRVTVVAGCRAGAE